MPIFSEVDAAATLFLFTVFGDKKSKSLRGLSGIKYVNKFFRKMFVVIIKNVRSYILAPNSIIISIF